MSDALTRIAVALEKIEAKLPGPNNCWYIDGQGGLQIHIWGPTPAPTEVKGDE